MQRSNWNSVRDFCFLLQVDNTIVSSVAFSADGKLLASGSISGDIRIFDSAKFALAYRMYSNSFKKIFSGSNWSLKNEIARALLRC